MRRKRQPIRISEGLPLVETGVLTLAKSEGLPLAETGVLTHAKSEGQPVQKSQMLQQDFCPHENQDDTTGYFSF